MIIRLLIVSAVLAAAGPARAETLVERGRYLVEGIAPGMRPWPA